jgi:hypothetical protein
MGIQMPRILIDGLPRTGTTTLARLFAIHPEARVMIEPFHPKRYSGKHNLEAVSADDPRHAFDPAWAQWNVIKHVWESGLGWPFTRRPELQEELWRSADVVIATDRQNFVKRYVSAEMSRALRFWIGTRQEFVNRLKNVCLLPLDIVQAKKSIQLDREAHQFRTKFLNEANICTVDFRFEEFFGSPIDRQLELANSLFSASGIPTLRFGYLLQHGSRWLNPSEYQWSSDEVYRAIPNIREFETAFSSEPGGSLFGDRK